MTTPRQRHASWRAQHASQHLPVRRVKPVVMHGAVGDVSANNAARVWAGDECCDTCGHYVCSCPPPASIEAPAPTAPVAAPQPAGAPFVVGARILVTLKNCYDRRPSTITAVDENDPRLPIKADVDGGEKGMWLKPGEFEPLPSETPERGDWTPEACGWSTDANWPGCFIAPGGLRRAYPYHGAYGWTGCAPSTAPTLAQACCAALGIELFDHGTGVRAMPATGNVLVATGDHIADVEACARLALERLHARAALAAHARSVSR